MSVTDPVREAEQKLRQEIALDKIYRVREGGRALRFVTSEEPTVAEPREA